MIYHVTTSNSWSPASYYAWTAVNIFNVLWLGIWSQGTKTAIKQCFVIIFLLALSLLWLWYTTYVPDGGVEKPMSYYLVRNTIAFYLGWVVGATVLSLGIMLVHVYEMDQDTFIPMFWIIAPTAGVFVTILNYS